MPETFKEYISPLIKNIGKEDCSLRSKIVNMTENNSKHKITMSLNSYTFSIKDYKLSRSTKVSEVSKFTNNTELCYMGYKHLRLHATALIEKSRVSEVMNVLSSILSPNSNSVVIDGMNIGKFILTDYEICGSEDDFLYNVSLSLCGS